MQHRRGTTPFTGTASLPMVEVRPTVFFENPFFSTWAAESIAEDGTIRLPFGAGRTSPIGARDVAEVVAVDHVGAHDHGDAGGPGANVDQLHAERGAGRVGGPHRSGGVRHRSRR